MLAVHDKAPGADRDQIRQRRLDPILGFHRVECHVPRGFVAGGEADQVADRGFVRRLGEMHRDIPAPAGSLERGDRGLALEEAFIQQIDHALGGRFAADRKAGAAGRGGDG